FANQQTLGVIPQGMKLTPWPADMLTPWDKLTPKAKKLFIRQVEVFAAYVAYRRVRGAEHVIGAQAGGGRGGEGVGVIWGPAKTGMPMESDFGPSGAPSARSRCCSGSGRTGLHFRTGWRAHRHGCRRRHRPAPGALSNARPSSLAARTPRQGSGWPVARFG